RRRARVEVALRRDRARGRGAPALLGRLAPCRRDRVTTRPRQGCVDRPRGRPDRAARAGRSRDGDARAPARRVDRRLGARGSRRRRAVALLATALAAGGLAASQVSGREREVEAQLGPPAPVLVAAADIKRGTRLTPEQLPHLLSVRDVPRRWLPPDVLAAPEQAVGLRAGVAIPAGAYVTAGAVEEGAADHGDRADPSTLGRGERAVNVTVAGAEAFAGA